MTIHDHIFTHVLIEDDGEEQHTGKSIAEQSPWRSSMAVVVAHAADRHYMAASAGTILQEYRK